MVLFIYMSTPLHHTLLKKTVTDTVELKIVYCKFGLCVQIKKKKEKSLFLFILTFNLKTLSNFCL